MTPKQEINAKIKTARANLKATKANLRLSNKQVAEAQRLLDKLLAQKAKL